MGGSEGPLDFVGAVKKEIGRGEVGSQQLRTKLRRRFFPALHVILRLIFQ